jgi:NADP oxidoreductase coenzyme F420-dependent
LSQMHRQSLTAYGQPLCETVVDCPSPRGGAAVQNGGPIPAKTPLSEDISKALKKRGFKFAGPSSSTPGCRRSAWSTITRRTVFAGRPFVRWRKEHETRDYRLRTDGQRFATAFATRTSHAVAVRGSHAKSGSAADLVRELGITRADDKALLSADVVFVAVPPAALSEVAADLKDYTGVVVSIIVPGAGGMTLAQQGASAAEQLAELLPKASVVRRSPRFLPC